MGKVPLFRPYMSWRAVWYAVRVLLSGKLTQGEWVERFERAFRLKFHLPSAVSVNSGTSALELAYHLADIKGGDEVIVPVLTCAATNVPLARRGAKIVFADIEEDLNISIEDVRRKITPHTRAVVFVHFGGNNRGLTELVGLCRERGITVIEDAAQAVGSRVWAIGDFACVSLQAIKTLTAVDGGVLVCHDPAHADRARRLRWFGLDRRVKLKHNTIPEAGWKFHMNNLNAAIALGNLYSLDKVLAHRKKLADIYKSYGIRAHTWLAHGTGKAKTAEILFKCLANAEVGQHHYRNDQYAALGTRQNLPVMDALEHHYFFVPFHYGVSKRQAHRIGKLYERLWPTLNRT